MSPSITATRSSSDRRPRGPLTLLAALLLWGGAHPGRAETRFLDLSKTANMGVSESLDDPVSLSALTDTQRKNGLNYLPSGPQTLRGVPFLLLDPGRNGGRSFLVLKGRRKPAFPDAVSIPADHLKAAYLYFLHTCRWGGTDPRVTVAEYDILYEDGQVAVIPLRVGVELTNFWGADDASACYLAWWYKYKYAEMGISLFPWKNPRPEEPIQSILFKSSGRMPVPILFAVTASDKELPISETSPKPEKTFRTDTSGWIPFGNSGASPVSTAVDMSFLLDAPAGKHGKVKSQGGRLVFEDGAPARFWGGRLAENWGSINPENYGEIVDRLAAMGFNLLVIDGPDKGGGGLPPNVDALIAELKSAGIYALFLGDVKSLPLELAEDPAVISKDLLSWEKTDWNKKTPMVLDPAASLPALGFLDRPLGAPSALQWSKGYPDEYSAEGPLLISVYGMFEGWDALAGSLLEALEKEPVKIGSSLGDRAALLTEWPVAALAFLRGDLKEGCLYVMDKDASPLPGMAHRSGIQPEGGTYRTDPAGPLKAKVNEKTSSFTSDTGQVTWQGNVGVVKIDSPRFQALIGFLANRKFNDPTWAVETSNLFASISLISLTKTAIPASDHLLITGVARMENTGMVYNEVKTKVIDPGKAPILLEPLKAQIVLYRYRKDPKLRVRALDANGQIVESVVPVKWKKNGLVLSWVPSAAYLEIIK